MVVGDRDTSSFGMDGFDGPDDSVQSDIDSVIDKTKRYVNLGLSMLMQCWWFGDVEATAQGCVLTTKSGKEYLGFPSAASAFLR